MNEITILNTRALEQQRKTADLFNAHGFDVINLPCIEIKSISSKQQAIQQLNQVKPDSIIIFTSQNAVNYAFSINPDWVIPQHSTVIAIGTKTAQCLEQYSHINIWVPEKQNSQGTIELLKGVKRSNSINLITAANGRELIQNYAEEKNISLNQINVYQRKIPNINTKINTLIGQTKKLYVLATSVATLINLQKLLSDNQWNNIKPNKLLCASKRIALKAQELGFSNVMNLQTANPEKIAKILTETK